MSQFFNDARAATSSPQVKDILDDMEKIEAAHTNEENARAWEWIRYYRKTSKKVRIEESFRPRMAQSKSASVIGSHSLLCSNFLSKLFNR